MWEFFGYPKDEDGKILEDGRWNANLQTLQEKSALQSGKHVQHGMPKSSNPRKGWPTSMTDDINISNDP